MIATQVSRPIRSASASGPIGWLKPSFAIVSIASGLGDALHQRVGGLVDERHQDPVGDEAGEVARLGGHPCRARAASSTIAAAVSSEVCDGADHLDELHQRHRVEEVHADDAVGPRRDGGERS